MKGLLFTELLEMVEEAFGYDTANAIVMKSKLSSKGIYTSAKNYHRSEMSLLFEQLQKQTQLPVDKLTQAFGKHLCRRMLIAYPQQRGYINRIFASITRRHSLPVFTFAESANRTLTIIYNPALQTTCITEGIIHGYLEQLHQLSRVQETMLSDGRRKFVLSLSE